MFKRLFFMLAIVASITFAQVAYASVGNHTDFSDTASCTTCHRQHDLVTNQSEGANYSQADQTTIYEYCTTCHGPENAGSDIDVVNGVYNNTSNAFGNHGEPLNSGGFDKIGGVSGSATTSAHSVDGTSYSIFGNSAGNSIALTCTSCHDLDGGSNVRLLKDFVNGKDVSNYVETNEVAGTTTATPHPDLPYTPNYTTPNYKSPSDLSAGISGWCAACHDNYKSEGFDVDEGDGRKHYYYTDTDGSKKYRHAVNAAIGDNPSGNTSTDLPLAKASATTADDNADNLVVCLTCHRAHGTDTTMTDTAQVGPTKDADSSGPGRSVLLRLNNRGVCQNCHPRP